MKIYYGVSGDPVVTTALEEEEMRNIDGEHPKVTNTLTLSHQNLFIIILEKEG